MTWSTGFTLLSGSAFNGPAGGTTIGLTGTVLMYCVPTTTNVVFSGPAPSATAIFSLTTAGTLQGSNWGGTIQSIGSAALSISSTAGVTPYGVLSGATLWCPPGGLVSGYLEWVPPSGGSMLWVNCTVSGQFFFSSFSATALTIAGALPIASGGVLQLNAPTTLTAANPSAGVVIGNSTASGAVSARFALNLTPGVSVTASQLQIGAASTWSASPGAPIAITIGQYGVQIGGPLTIANTGPAAVSFSGSLLLVPALSFAPAGSLTFGAVQCANITFAGGALTFSGVTLAANVSLAADSNVTLNSAVYGGSVGLPTTFSATTAVVNLTLLSGAVSTSSGAIFAGLPAATTTAFGPLTGSTFAVSISGVTFVTPPLVLRGGALKFVGTGTTAALTSVTCAVSY
jgi:hypothetical protein